MFVFRSATPVLAVSALALAACGSGAEEEKTYEVGVEDVGGGELQVADPQPGEVEVNLPETPMKNVPVEADDDADAAAEDGDAQAD